MLWFADGTEEGAGVCPKPLEGPPEGCCIGAAACAAACPNGFGGGAYWPKAFAAWFAGCLAKGFAPVDVGPDVVAFGWSKGLVVAADGCPKPVLFEGGAP